MRSVRMRPTTDKAIPIQLKVFLSGCFFKDRNPNTVPATAARHPIKQPAPVKILATDKIPNAKERYGKI